MVAPAGPSTAVIDGRYVLLERVGVGAFGEVWRARDERLGGRSVAVKFLRSEHLAAPDIVARFQNEAVALGMLQHPNIVGVIDRGAWQAAPFLVMEFVEGEPLDAWLAGLRRQRRPPPLPIALGILDQVADALGAAHALRPVGPIVHRDLKPANVLLGAGTGAVPRVKVLDFGIAQLGTRSLTQTGSVMGSAGYMAPEQALGRSAEVGPWTDVFSLGVLALELFTLSPSPSEQPLWSLTLSLPTAFDGPIVAMRPDLPRELWAEVLRALSPSSAARHRDASAFRDALRRAAAAADQGDRTLADADLDATMLDAPGSFAPPMDAPVQGTVMLNLGQLPRAPPLQERASLPAYMPVSAPTVMYQSPQVVAKPAPVPIAVKAGIVGAAALLAAIVVAVLGETRPVALRDCDHGYGEDCVVRGQRAATPDGGLADDARAAAFYLRGCNARAPLGCNLLADAHEAGRGVARDLARATALREQGCAAGHSPSCVALARTLRAGRGVRRDPDRSFRLLTQACDRRDVDACAYLGDAWRDGVGTQSDLGRAAALYRQACTARGMIGCERVGRGLRDGQGFARDDAQAVRMFQEACTGGLAEGCVGLGGMYLEGRGVDRDEGRASQLFHSACDARCAEGCVWSGRSYLEGRGVDRDEGRASQLFRQSCDAEEASGCHELAKLHLRGAGVARDDGQAIQLFQRACGMEHGPSCWSVGDLTIQGRGAVRDLPSAFNAFRRGCELRHGESCLASGRLTLRGAGVVEDAAAALQRFTRACSLSSAEGCAEAAVLQHDGRGTVADPVQAYRLHERACALRAYECNAAGWAIEHGDGAQVDMTLAANRYRRACDGGSDAGCNNYGTLLFSGRGVPRDVAHATIAFRRACDHGDRVACDNLRIALRSR